MGMIRTKQGKELKADGTIEGNPSVLVDAVAVPEGEESLQTLMQDGKAKHYLCQAYRHLKAIALPSHARQLLQAAGLPDDAADAVAIALCHARSATSLMQQEARFDPCSTT